MDIDSSYSDYLNTVASNAQSTASNAALSNTLKSTGSSSTDEEMMDACKQFESYFVEQMFKEMEKTVPDDELDQGSNSQLLDYYKEQLVQKYAETATDQQSLGLAQMLYNQMKRNNTSADEIDAAGSTAGTDAS